MAKQSIISLLLACCVLAPTANAQTQVNPLLPTALGELIATRYPAATVVSHSSLCKSSPKGFEQVGLALKMDKTSAPLHAVIAVLGVQGWVLSDMPRKYSYPRGGGPDFLDGFDETSAPEVRCTTPNHDEFIGTSINGLYMLKNSDARKKTAKHICFAADTVYNSWVCYWTPPTKLTPQISFIQMNAD